MGKATLPLKYAHLLAHGLESLYSQNKVASISVDIPRDDLAAAQRFTEVLIGPNLETSSPEWGSFRVSSYDVEGSREEIVILRF